MAAGTIGLIAVAIAVLAIDPHPSAPQAGGFAGSIRPPGPPLDFALRDERGDRIRLSDDRGRPVIVTFMYTTCKDTCPLTATQIRGALDDLKQPPPALAVSVDPVNDTPEREREFLFRRGLSHGRMRFLLGDRAELRPVWKAYGIQPQGKAFDHSAYVLLIDRHGRQRIGFPVQQLTPEGLAHDIRRLQAEA